MQEAKGGDRERKKIFSSSSVVTVFIVSFFLFWFDLFGVIFVGYLFIFCFVFRCCYCCFFICFYFFLRFASSFFLSLVIHFFVIFTSFFRFFFSYNNVPYLNPLQFFHSFSSPLSSLSLFLISPPSSSYQPFPLFFSLLALPSALFFFFFFLTRIPLCLS